jgi:3'-phosphoadenosine 5'-phosphosulfate (PAPS) 3'-phosphatase
VACSKALRGACHSRIGWSRSNPGTAQPIELMKIFGIGLSKTGTTSLASALEILGFRTKDYPGLTSYAPGDLASIDPAVLEHNEALTDTPIPSFYRELDQRYPGARFILTVRDMDGWLLSCKKQFTAKLAEKQNGAHNRLFMDLYGTAVFDEALFREGYQRFVDGVLNHFKGRPQDLLVLDVAAGQGWNELCAFLGKPVPATPFPKSNVTRIQWMDLQALVSIAKEAGDELLRAHRSLVTAKADGRSPALISALVRKAVHSLGGGGTSAPEAAEAAHSLLTRRLERLNPEIPVISRHAHATPLEERGHWSHLWMIDALDGEAGFGTARGEFTVNIALIENQKPIAGVVHSPLSGTTYYAMVGKGAYKSLGNGPASRLDTPDRHTPATGTAVAHETQSKALAICGLLDGDPGAAAEIGESMEWQSAAPHAVARLVGRRVVASDSMSDLAYNKGDWCNPRIRVA